MKKIGKKTLSELAAMANEIPDGVDWEKLKSHELMDNLRGRLALWAQEGIMIAGDRHIMAKLEKEKKKMVLGIEQRDKLLAEAREEVREKERLLLLRAQANEKLQDELDARFVREHTFQENLKHAEFREGALKDRVEKADREVVLLNRQVTELQVELDGRRPEAEVIRAYKESDEHLEALMDAAADDLQKCWVVTKKLTQTDLDHSYNELCDAFFAEDEPKTTEQDPVPPSDPSITDPQGRVEEVVDPVGAQAQGDVQALQSQVQTAQNQEAQNQEQV